MSQFFEVAEAEKTAGALDGMDGAENAGERVPVSGILLEHHELIVELIQSLQTLGQEFLDDLIHGGLACSRQSPWLAPGGGKTGSQCFSPIKL